MKLLPLHSSFVSWVSSVRGISYSYWLPAGGEIDGNHFQFLFKSAPHMGPRTLCPGQSCGVAGTDSAIPERWQASSQRNPEAGLAQMKIVKDSEEIWAAHKWESIDFL